MLPLKFSSRSWIRIPNKLLGNWWIRENSPNRNSPHENSPTDILPHGQLAQRPTCPMNNSTHGQLAPLTTRPIIKSSHGQHKTNLLHNLLLSICAVFNEGVVGHSNQEYAVQLWSLKAGDITCGWKTCVGTLLWNLSRVRYVTKHNDNFILGPYRNIKVTNWNKRGQKCLPALKVFFIFFKDSALDWYQLPVPMIAE